MLGLVGITQAQLDAILNSGSEDVMRFCQRIGLMPTERKFEVCKSQMKLTHSRGKQKTQSHGVAACRFAATKFQQEMVLCSHVQNYLLRQSCSSSTFGLRVAPLKARQTS